MTRGETRTIAPKSCTNPHDNENVRCEASRHPTTRSGSCTSTVLFRIYFEWVGTAQVGASSHAASTVAQRLGCGDRRRILSQTRPHPEELNGGGVPIGRDRDVALGRAAVDAGDIDLNPFEHGGSTTRRTGRPVVIAAVAWGVSKSTAARWINRRSVPQR